MGLKIFIYCRRQRFTEESENVIEMNSFYELHFIHARQGVAKEMSIWFHHVQDDLMSSCSRGHRAIKKAPEVLDHGSAYNMSLETDGLDMQLTLQFSRS